MAIREIQDVDGIRIYECDAWQDFFEHVCFGMGEYDTDFLWRGQRNASWELKPSLSRVPGGHNSLILKYYKHAIQGLTTQKFDIANSEVDRLRLWALGQHFGLKTPLIDFTQFPFVALFFAFVERNEPDQEDMRAVLALGWHQVRCVNTDVINSHMTPFLEKIKSAAYDVDFEEYLLTHYPGPEEQRAMIKSRRLSPQFKEWVCRIEQARIEERQMKIHITDSDENVRVHRQGGVHIYPPEPLSIEEWCREYAKYLSPPNVPIIRKFLVPNKDRHSIIRSLNKMNVNYASLFPDLGGAALYCNLALEEGKGTLSSLRAY